MYKQYPYNFNGTYYANIDGELIEITKEVAKAMSSTYRNEIYRSRKWQPDEAHPEKPTELLDCVFSANAEGISLEDLPDPTQMSLEDMVIMREEHAELHQKLEQLDPRERFIVKSIYFDGMKQVEVAEILGITKGRLSQKLSAILKKMRRMYEAEENF